MVEVDTSFLTEFILPHDSGVHLRLIFGESVLGVVTFSSTILQQLLTSVFSVAGYITSFTLTLDISSKPQQCGKS